MHDYATNDKLILKRLTRHKKTEQREAAPFCIQTGTILRIRIAHLTASATEKLDLIVTKG
jgi:hypothetical protein